jgi:hypothetical protein
MATYEPKTAETLAKSTEFLSVVCLKAAVGNAAQCHGPIQHRLEYRSEIAGRGVDDLQHLGHRGLLSLTFVAFGGAFDQSALRFVTLCTHLGELALKVSEGRLKIGRGAVGRRAHVRPRSAVLSVQSYPDRRSRHRLVKRMRCRRLAASSPLAVTGASTDRKKEWSRPPEPIRRTRDVGAAATSGDRM